MSLLVFHSSDYFPSSASSSSHSSYAPPIPPTTYKSQNSPSATSSSVVKCLTTQSHPSASKGIMLIDGVLVEADSSAASTGPPKSSSKKSDKNYFCSWNGCNKSYTKPIRLKEHERSHTNERPHVCPHCPATYRRDTHLTAHMRMHLPEEAKPLVCGWVDNTSSNGNNSQPCSKRFWTRQHWKVHRETTHEGKKGQPKFLCVICQSEFLKHHLLRTHHAEVHCSPGTKPFICPKLNCGKSFATGSKLRKHEKTHEENRYTCSHPDCLQSDEVSLQDRCFATWSDLQKHTRDIHPPRCFQGECDGKTFRSHKALREHNMVFHSPGHTSSDSGVSSGAIHLSDRACNVPPSHSSNSRPEAPFKCLNYDTKSARCAKSYQSLRALQSHISAVHKPSKSSPLADQREAPPTAPGPIIAKRRRTTTRVERLTQLSLLTGAGYGPETDLSSSPYAGLTGHAVKRKFACPIHLLQPQSDSNLDSSSSHVIQTRCPLRFNRVYDVQRHLRSDHGIDAERDALKVLFEV